MPNPKTNSTTDVLLIVPPFHFQRFNRYDDNQSGGHMIYYPHLGMLIMAASLARAGFRPAFVDAEAERLNTEGILDRIRKLNPGVVGITVTSPTLDSVYRLIGEIKRTFSNGTRPGILLGGPHVTIDPEIVEFLGADFGLAGEAERSIVDFCRWRLKGETPPKPIPGFVDPGGKGPGSGPLEVIEALGDLPHPMRSLAPRDHYFNALWGKRVTSILGARGCPFNCAFCDRAVTGRKFRLRPPGDVLSEVDELIKSGFRFLTFVDEVFTFDRDWFEAVVEGLRVRPVEFSCQTRADLVDDEVFKSLRRAGCRLVSFGVETDDDNRARFLGKNLPEDKIFNAVAGARKAGLMVNAFYMLGLPGDIEEQFRGTLSLARELNTEFIAVNILARLPGSELGREHWEQDKTVWRNFALGNSRLPIIHFDPGERQRLVELCKEFYRGYYLRPALVWRHLSRLRSLKDAEYLLRQAWVFMTQYAT